MKDRIGRFLNIRKDESLYVSYLLFHYFFMGIGLALLLIVANTLFLANFNEEKLPEQLALVFISSAIGMMAIGKVNEYFSNRWSEKKMLKAMVIFCAAAVFIFYAGAQFFYGFIWMPFLLYICYKVVASQMDFEFWGLASIIFDVRQAKRLFGLISVGDAPAKLLGMLSIAVLVPRIGLVNLLLISTASFIIGAILLHNLLSKLKPHHFEHHDQAPHTAATKGKSILLRFFQSDFVMALAFLYFIGAVTVTFTEFSFLTQVEHKMVHEAELASFLSLVYSVGYSIIILFKVFLSGKAIERFGIRRSLLSLPVFLLLASLGVFIIGRFAPDETPLMWLFTAMVILGEVFKAVLYEPLFLALFQPLPGHIRHHAHTVMSGFVSPLGLGLSGIALYSGISIFHSVDLYKINYVLLVLILIWTFLVLFTVRKYLANLKTAINKRLINSRQLNMGDARSLEILKSKLRSQRPDEVIYTADMLQKTHPIIFEETLPQLLQNETREVRLYALNKIYELHVKPDIETLYGIITSDESPKVQEIAVRVYCSVYEDIVDQITPMLDYPDLIVRSAAIKGFLKSGDLEAMIIGGQKLISLVQSKDVNEVIEAVDVIGDLGFKNYYKPLLELMHHKNPEVKKAVIMACGKIRNPKLIPDIVSFLDDNMLKKTAMEALGKMGVIIFDYFKETSFGLKYEEETIKLCSRIGGEYASEIIFRDYFKKANAEILNEVLKALNRLPFNLKTHQEAINDKLTKELDFAHSCLAMIPVLDGDPGCSLLSNAIREELLNSKMRIFMFLSLLFEKATIDKAKNAAFSQKTETKANALEYLENLLDRELKIKLFPLIDEGEQIQNIHPDSSSKHHKSTGGIVHELLSSENNHFLNWTHAVTLYECHEFIDEKTLKKFAGSTHILVSECAEFALGKPLKSAQNMSANQHLSTQASMLEIEKVLILKSTNMFAATPENILVGIASIAREEIKQKGENIFKKDDLGNCLFIICEGEISIHVEGKQLSVLQNRDIFGELALLDPEPRSATATAISDCLLLRIDQGAFNELIEDRPEVAQGILTILSKRIRNQNMVIRELQNAVAPKPVISEA